MKIQIASDLHLEFYKSPDAKKRQMEMLAAIDADVTILAGDIAQTQIDFDMIESVFATSGRPALFVYGNHEFYGQSIDDKIQTNSYSNLIFMRHDSIIEIDGVKFWGDTMWTEFPDGFDPGHHVNDTRVIKDFDGHRWNELHKLHKNSLLDHIAEIDVVITHHAPSYKSVSHGYEFNISNYCFVNDFDEIIKNSNIKLWVHGHVHSSFDYEIGRTRVSCNPYGYNGGGKNDRFQFDKIVEI